MSKEFDNNIVKIKYSNEGYLPYYPYHLLSDSEMLDAFIFNDSNFFDDTYPCPCDSLLDEYNTLKQYIQACCTKAKQEDDYCLPDWIYTYMLGEVINFHSSQKDVHDLLVLLNLDNLYDEFDEEIYTSIYKVSKAALGTARVKAKAMSENVENFRPCTMFGEPHIVKYLRLEQASA